MKVNYIIDYSNFTYKYTSVYDLYRKVSGVKVNISALYGWVRALKANPFNDISICLDGFPKNHLRILPSYKGQRIKEPNESVSVSKADIIEVLTGIGEILGKNISVFYYPHAEADQVMASLTELFLGKVSQQQRVTSMLQESTIEEDPYLKKITNKFEHTCEYPREFDTMVLGTTDSDLYQLTAFDNVFVDASTSGKNINFSKETPKSVDHVAPHLIALYKSIIGDSSDNVPSLNLSMKKAQIEKALSTLESLQASEEFYRNLLRRNNPYKGLLSDLITQLLVNQQVEDFSRNYQITKLQFIGTPRKLISNHRTKEILRKYNIKL